MEEVFPRRCLPVAGAILPGTQSETIFYAELMIRDRGRSMITPATERRALTTEWNHTLSFFVFPRSFFDDSGCSRSQQRSGGPLR